MAEDIVWHVCTKCHNSFPRTIEFFYKNGTSKVGTPVLNPSCKKCTSIRNKTYREKNKKPKNPKIKKSELEIAEIKKKKRLLITPAEREKRNARQRERLAERRKEDPEQVRAPRRINARKYRKNNPDVIAARRKRHRARKDGSCSRIPHTLTDQDWRWALAYWKGCCAVCETQDSFWKKLCTDHWIPLSDPMCPGTILSNCVPLCHGIGGCNNSKKNKEPIGWLIERLGLRQAKKKIEEIERYILAAEEHMQNRNIS